MTVYKSGYKSATHYKPYTGSNKPRKKSTFSQISGGLVAGWAGWTVLQEIKKHLK